MKKTRRIILALCLLLMVTMLVTLNACVSTGDDGSQTDTTQQTDADTTGDPDTGDGSGCTHSWSAWAVVTPATCTEQGREERICAQCQTTENRAIDALSHSYGEWSVTTEATCQADGLETRVCANDATHVETRKVQKLSHTFDKEVAELVYLKSAATCTAKAVYYKSCVCGLHETGEQAATFVYGPEPTHAYGAWETTGAQSHKRVCACGAEETANHAWNDGEIKRAPTHTVAGLTTYTCTVCGATEDREIEKTTEHSFRADDFVYHDETLHKHFCACGLVE